MQFEMFDRDTALPVVVIAGCSSVRAALPPLPIQGDNLSYD
jgi:hypothetical protein